MAQADLILRFVINACNEGNRLRVLRLSKDPRSHRASGDHRASGVRRLPKVNRAVQHLTSLCLA